MLLAVNASTKKIVFANQCKSTGNLKKLLEKCSNSEERQLALQTISTGGDDLKTKPASNWSSFYNWGSGGLTPLIPGDPVQKELAAIFQHLGKELASLTGFGENHMFRRNTLYHGHLVYNAAQKEDLLVFHAAEYPTDLETIKAGHTIYGKTDKNSSDIIEWPY